MVPKAVATLIESYGNRHTDDKELLAIRIKSAGFIEEKKRCVCVYIPFGQIIREDH